MVKEGRRRVLRHSRRHEPLGRLDIGILEETPQNSWNVNRAGTLSKLFPSLLTYLSTPLLSVQKVRLLCRTRLHTDSLSRSSPRTDPVVQNFSLKKEEKHKIERFHCYLPSLKTFVSNLSNHPSVVFPSGSPGLSVHLVPQNKTSESLWSPPKSPPSTTLVVKSFPTKQKPPHKVLTSSFLLPPPDVTVPRILLPPLLPFLSTSATEFSLTEVLKFGPLRLLVTKITKSLLVTFEILLCTLTSGNFDLNRGISLRPSPKGLPPGTRPI